MKRTHDAEKIQELEKLQKKNERLRREQELSRGWMKLHAEFRREGQELPPPTFLNDDKEPSETQPLRSRTIINKKIGGRRIQSARKTHHTVSKVGESHFTTL